MEMSCCCFEYAAAICLFMLASLLMCESFLWIQKALQTSFLFYFLLLGNDGSLTSLTRQCLDTRNSEVAIACLRQVVGTTIQS